MQDALEHFLSDFEKSGRDLRAFIELLPIPLLLCREWEIVHLNAMSRRVLPGVDIQSLVGRRFLDFVPAREATFIEKNLHRMTGENYYQFNVHVRTPEVVVDLSTVSHLVLIEGIRYLLVAFQDLSSFSEREKALFRLMFDSFSLTGKELYQTITEKIVANFGVNVAALAESLPDSFRVTTIAGCIDGQPLKMNEAEFKGTLMEQVLQQSTLIVERGLIDRLPQDDFIQSNGFEALVGVSIPSESQSNLVLYALSRKPIHDTAGISLVLSVCGVRISSDYASQSAREAAERQERDYRLLVEQSADPMFVVDASGRILMANNRATELAGYSKAELRNFFDLIADHHHPFFRGFFRKRFGILSQSNVVFIQKSRNRAYCDLSGVILSDGRIQLNVRDNTDHLLTEIALRQSEEKYRSIFDNASDAIFLSDLESGRILDCNLSFQKLVGSTRDAILQMTHFDLVQPRDRGRFRKIFDYYRLRKKLDAQPGKFRLTIQNHHGHFLPIEIAVARLDRESTQLIIGIIRDLTVSYQAIAEHRKYMQTLSLLHVIVVELDEELKVCFINNAIPRFGRTPELQGTYFPDLVAEDYRWYVESTLQEMIRNQSPGNFRFPIKAAVSGLDWYEAEIVFVRDRSSRARIRGLIRDVTFDYIVEKTSLYMANTDMLTSLPNRNRLEEDLFRAMLRADRTEKKLAVGFVDLDRFFDVNDQLGHRMGDTAIALFAERLHSFPELERSLYRWGGDQFVFLVESLGDVGAIRRLLDRIRDSVREPLLVEGHTIHITCTIGVSLYPDDARTVDGLFGQADRALQYGKRNGRFQFLFWQDIQQNLTGPDRMSVRNHLVHAIHNGLVEPFFQPIFDLETGRISGMEALARLPDAPEFAAIGPEIFIPVAEDLGIIEELSHVVLSTALEFHKRLLDAGFDLRLSVNLSRRVLYSNRLMDYLGDLLRHTGVDPRSVCLEITETVAMLDIKNASERLNELKNLGFILAIDDFGTGYSTLGQLYEIPVDEIKIDKLFVRRMHTHEGLRIAEAIVSMARALSLDVVAEGVEEKETVECLRHMGVRYLQGYFFSPPVSRQEFEKLIREKSSTQVV